VVPVITVSSRDSRVPEVEMPFQSPQLRDSAISVLRTLSLACCFASQFDAAVAVGQSASSGPGGYTVSGKVIFNASRQPASQVAVTLHSESAGIFRSFLTDQAGKFSVAGLPGDDFEIAVEEAGYETYRTEVHVDASNIKLEIKLSPDNRPLAAGATVSVRELQIPDKAASEYQKGLTELAQHRYDKSLPHFLKAASVFPKYVEAFNHLGVAELELGRKQEAMQAFQTAIDLSAGLDAKAQLGVAAVLCDVGNPRDAEPIVRRVLETDRQSQGYALLGLILVRLSRIKEGEAAIQEALLRSPANGEAYLVAAEIHADRRDYQAELNDLGMYLALRPNGSRRALVARIREGLFARKAEPEAIQQAALQ
jgi:tetratricopeptide (TPR) repeat protein